MNRGERDRERYQGGRNRGRKNRDSGIQLGKRLQQPTDASLWRSPYQRDITGIVRLWDNRYQGFPQFHRFREVDQCNKTTLQNFDMILTFMIPLEKLRAFVEGIVQEWKIYNKNV